jgi:hypothetical protein
LTAGSYGDGKRSNFIEKEKSMGVNGISIVTGSRLKGMNITVLHYTLTAFVIFILNLTTIKPAERTLGRVHGYFGISLYTALMTWLRHSNFIQAVLEIC